MHIIIHLYYLMQNKDKDLDDGFNKQPLKVHQVTEELPKVSCECDVGIVSGKCS